MTTPFYTARDIIALALVPNAGRKTIHLALRLAARSGRPMDTLLETAARDLLDIAAPGEEVAVHAMECCGAAEQSAAGDIEVRCQKFGLHHRVCGDDDYPASLLDALGTQAPPLLFLKGNEALLATEGAAIVGTRTPTETGAGWARDTAGHLATEGTPIISGGADGIDQEAHQAALRADGTTVVILPEGLLNHQPHPAIRRGMDRGQVLLVSEFLPPDGWATFRAMTRNRTIAALARMVCVLEPRDKGGSMYTAEQALDLGKPVFYWGGACRDGALRDRAKAAPLVRKGRLDGGALQRAMQAPADTAPRQGELFG